MPKITIDYYIDRCIQLQSENESLNNRIAELEHKLANEISRSKGLESKFLNLYSEFSELKELNEKIQPENSELKSHLEKHGKRINELELELVQNEAEWEEKTEKLQATLDGLLNLTDYESSDGNASGRLVI